MDTLPPPPAEIQYHPIDLNNPLHAKAYLKAASHFLSSWPKDWSALKLCLTMIDDDDNIKNEITPWETIFRDVNFMDDPWVYAEELIRDLAEDFVIFLSENA